LEGVIGPGKQFACSNGQSLCGRGGLQAIVLADEERLADALFQRPYLFRNAGLRQMHLFGGFREAQRFHRRDEDLQLS